MTGAPQNPLDLLKRWVADAADANLPLPHAMTLATADTAGMPHARTVLATGIDEVSVRFNTSAPTTKTRDLAANPHASAVFCWPALGRQAVLTGPTTELTAAESDAEFAALSRHLQLVAWAYDALLPGAELPPGAVEDAYAKAATDPASATRPPTWTTIALTPAQADFWVAGEPPTKTRYRRRSSTWRHFATLP